MFIENDGFSVLMRAMQTDVEKLKVKAAFMLSALCVDRPDIKGRDLVMLSMLVLCVDRPDIKNKD